MTTAKRNRPKRGPSPLERQAQRQFAKKIANLRGPRPSVSIRDIDAIIDKIEEPDGPFCPINVTDEIARKVRGRAIDDLVVFRREILEHVRSYCFLAQNALRDQTSPPSMLRKRLAIIASRSRALREAIEKLENDERRMLGGSLNGIFSDGAQSPRQVDLIGRSPMPGNTLLRSLPRWLNQLERAVSVSCSEFDSGNSGPPGNYVLWVARQVGCLWAECNGRGSERDKSGEVWLKYLDMPSGVTPAAFAEVLRLTFDPVTQALDIKPRPDWLAIAREVLHRTA